MLNWKTSRLTVSLILLASCLDNCPLNCLFDPDVAEKFVRGRIVIKLGKTVYPVVLHNEITLHGLQLLFTSNLHSGCIRLSEKDRGIQKDANIWGKGRRRGETDRWY